jgi:hypothetical protein
VETFGASEGVEGTAERGVTWDVEVTGGIVVLVTVKPGK